MTRLLRSSVCCKETDLQHFFLNNQPDALIIQNLFCYKTLHVSGNLFAHHQEFFTVHSVLASFVQVFDDRFQAESGCLDEKGVSMKITFKLNFAIMYPTSNICILIN